MKKYPIVLTTVLTLGMAIGMTFDSHAAKEVLTNYQFGKTNPLATGKWVKISIEGSGIYEISYAELREMGFSDPSKVAVYGLGGLKRNINFLRSNGDRLLEDEIKSVPVMHSNDKLLFYGLGDRKVTYYNEYQGTIQRPGFIRESLNTSSFETYYMLTDSHPMATPAQGPKAESSATLMDNVYGCIYHEVDLVNGLHESGDLWWGEDVYYGAPYITTVSAPYVKDDSRVSFYCDYAVTATQVDGTFTINLNKNAFSNSINKNRAEINSMYSHSTRNKLNIDPDTHIGTANLEFSVQGNYGLWGFNIGIDNWILAYDSSLGLIDDDPGFTQFTAGFNGASTGLWKHPAPKDAVVWDITYPANPISLNIEDGYFYNDRAGAGSLVTFDPQAMQKRINPGYEEVANQDLHKMQDTPYDMIIFTVPYMRKYAERIAELHKQYDGMNVAVLTNEEIFNEFNAGTPEPTCYRMITKMLYQHPERRLKNVLFLGPIYADYRNIRQVSDRPEGLIAYQDNLTDLSTVSNLAMDYYGILTDNLMSVIRIDSAPISVGVGLLPISTDMEGEIAVAKIRAYLEKEDFSSTVNSTYSISCEGDDHLHEKQAIGFGETINQIVSNNLKSKFAHETLWTEPLDPSQTTSRIQDAMRRGKSIIYYYGHANTSGFTGLGTFDSMTAGNKELGFIYYGGCDLSKIDMGESGSGDSGVTRTKNGFIGILASTRTAMSNHNESLGNNLLNSMFFGRDDKWLKSTPTIGEVLSRAKENTTNNSEVSFVYVGDPALRVPVALTSVRIDDIDGSYRSGEVVTVSGTVTDRTGEALTDYNGFVTVTLMEPARMVVTPQPTNPKDIKMPDYEINDLPILAVKGFVKDGRFSVKLPLPESVDAYLSDADTRVKMPVYVGTWDNMKKLGGTGTGEFAMALYNATEPDDAEKDETAPVLTLSYDNMLGVLTAEASDDVAMLPGIGAGTGMKLTVDGTDISLPHEYSADDAVSQFSGYVNVAYLSNGKHTAVLSATDLCGNTSQKILEFTVAEPAALKLYAETEIAPGEITLSLRGINASMTYELYIADINGNLVSTQQVNGTSVTIDTTELTHGVYKAWAHHPSAMGRKSKSNEVEFTVI